MSIMILAHFRSKSSLMADCFNNYIGEVFNIDGIDKNTFAISQEPIQNKAPSHWNEEWVSRYLTFLEEKITKNDNIVFKVFLEQVIFNEEALNLIKRVKPRVICIHRKNELSAIKSFIIARRRGFVQHEQTSFEPFKSTFFEFFIGYRNCTLYPKLWRTFFSPEWSTTYEEFDPLTFPYAERAPMHKAQYSAEVFSQIINEDEIDKWYTSLQSPMVNGLI